jgi:hypothetical protein
MTTSEFSDAFDVLLNSYCNQAQFGEQSSKTDIVLDEYEKSVFLTDAQEEITINLYNGKNHYGDSFESTEEIRRYLDNLVKTKVYDASDAGKDSEGQLINDDGIHVVLGESSFLFTLPDDVAFITLEQVSYDDSTLGCYDQSIASVYPVSQDEYNRIKNNPFKGPTKYKVLRLDIGKGIVELISKYKIGYYLVRYLSRPTPIILEDLPNGLTIRGEYEKTECSLNPILHDAILKRAVLLALQAKGISVNK